MASNKKLSTLCRTIKSLKNDINIFKMQIKSNPIEIYKLSHPNTKTSKKYSCLILTSIDESISEELNEYCENSKLHSIKIERGDYIINYSITLENDNNINNTCEVFLATQEIENNKKKFKSIIGTFTTSNKLNINNTILYKNVENIQNLYIIIKLNNCRLHESKNLLKIIKMN